MLLPKEKQQQKSCYVTVIKMVSGVDFDLATEGLKRRDKVA